MCAITDACLCMKLRDVITGLLCSNTNVIMFSSSFILYYSFFSFVNTSYLNDERLGKKHFKLNMFH